MSLNIVSTQTPPKALTNASSWVDKDQFFLTLIENRKFPTGSIFYQLVNLELHTYKAEWWNLLLLMLDASPRLQVLKLLHNSCNEYWDRSVACKKWSQPNKVPECLSSHLETFVWRSYRQRLEEEKVVAKYILSNAARLKRASFSEMPLQERNSQEMVVELESVVRASDSCELVFE